MRHYGPGGREHGGGIGRFIGYVTDAASGSATRHLVTDTRGPRWSPLASPARLAGAMLATARDRLLVPGRVHHIHLAGRGSTARKLLLTAWARGLGCRHILHLHDYDYASDVARRPPRYRALIRRMFQGADAVIVLGQHDRRLAVETLLSDPGKVAVFGNCVPDPGPPDYARRDAAALRDGPTILFLGRLGPRKGVPELLEALASPALSALPWRAILAGDGPVEAYRQQARDLGLDRRVEMPGWLDAEGAAALCRRADILVLPSHAEGMAMAVLEGLAHGLAVVTTPVGAHGEVITDGVTGVFVAPGDAPGLAGALAALVRDPARRLAIAQRGRALFLSRFGMAAYMARLDDLYDAVSRESRRSAATQGRGA
ncbi:glycosyltransferase family 4 protein [Paracoccus sp. (in: a-proteobacteria)]|uniref:glycosyltransferase family 4 protein n=1 Tax=Paracoccus sp. TaxID=267 RepID=UPI0035B180B7